MDGRPYHPGYHPVGPRPPAPHHLGPSPAPWAHDYGPPPEPPSKTILSEFRTMHCIDLHFESCAREDRGFFLWEPMYALAKQLSSAGLIVTAISEAGSCYLDAKGCLIGPTDARLFFEFHSRLDFVNLF